MSLWSRLANVFRGESLNREIDEDGCGIRLITWFDSLRADAVFGWRQLTKRKVTSAAAILSLALAIGACTSAFRLIDALLLRPLPVSEPERLYVMSREGIGPEDKPQKYDECEYPLFRQMRAAVKDQADLVAISTAERTDLTYGTDQEMEKANLQYVSGWMFGTFGLRPAAGRLFTESDDVHPGAHPYAVISYDYWTSRFGQDPKVVGRTFRMGNDLYQIVGVSEERFTGTEPGTIAGIFVPTMMNPYVERSDASWFRTLAHLKPGAAVEPVRARMHATLRAFQEERARGFTGMSKQRLNNFLNQTLLLEPATAGVSSMQKSNRLPLQALAVLVALVLLIACANVANLMTAQAAARSREMALRISIGAGRLRLMQLVLVESAWLAVLATAIGALFAWWSAPFVVSMINPPDNPARLSLPWDWQVVGFGLGLAIGVMLLFGLLPALRASAVKPATALKGGDNPHSRRRLMHALIAVQVAFCFLVLFVAGLFVATFDRLSNQGMGFSAERLLTLDTRAQRAQPPVVWDQVAEHLRGVPGVETVVISDHPLLDGYSMNNLISINGSPQTEILTYFRNVSPGWIDAMKIPLIDGRDFRATDTSPGVAIVNETFARQYFNGENPVGKSFSRRRSEIPYQIVGLVRDARYRRMREPILPVAYVPFASADVNRGTFIVRTAGPDPLTLARVLRREVSAARSDFRVSNIRTQTEIIQSQTVRERLLAMLATFFAVVALVLAGVGLYGVLDYSVLQRRRELGIRMAIGAQAGGIARLVTLDVFSMVLAGAVAGVTLGMASVRYIETLFYQVKATDAGVLALPSMAILAAALLAALPAVIHAVRIDPATTLRAE